MTGIGQHAQQVSSNERPLWVDLSRPIINKPTAGIGAEETEDAALGTVRSPHPNRPSIGLAVIGGSRR
jgi:hypothetical protein